MTDLSTLLHAAARGARIQKRTGIKHWVDCIFLEPLFMDAFPEIHRIHPDDEHLMWGPLSRQYYERALHGVDLSLASYAEVFDDLVCCDIPITDWYEQYNQADEPTRRMILLTIALALRDEGM